jgi:hypothetical protein
MPELAAGKFNSGWRGRNSPLIHYQTIVRKMPRHYKNYFRLSVEKPASIGTRKKPGGAAVLVLEGDLLHCLGDLYIAPEKLVHH